MNPDSEPTPPIVLSYANPISAQPVDGRLTLKRDERGITLRDSISTATSPHLIRWAGAILLVGGLVVPILCRSGLIDRDHIPAALTAAVCGAICIASSWRAKQEPCCARIESGRLYTKSSAAHDWVSRHFNPKHFGTRNGGFDTRTGNGFMVVVQYLPFLTFSLFTSLSWDEAIWAVHMLETGLIETSKCTAPLKGDERR